MKKYQLVCKMSIAAMVMHLVLWCLVGIFTLGLGFLFYPFFLVKRLLNSTEMHEIEEKPFYQRD